MTEQELRAIEIYQWSDFKAAYPNPDLLLGNGFSMNLDQKFNYPSLFNTFLAKCPAHLHDTFKLFGTTNFELILEYLKYSLKVNQSLGLPIDPIQEAIEVLRNGLIEAINEIHPRVAKIDWGRLQGITKQLAEFSDIYTTNYDLYLYHIIMQAIDLRKADKTFRPYNDYFWGEHHAPAGFKEFVPYQTFRIYKHIYYLHGALFIFPHGQYDIKITRGANVELMDVIAEEIQKDNFPVFVSEGEAVDKVDSIYRSSYLRFSLRKLESTGKPLMIYGNSLSEVDKHIVDSIKVFPRPLIICIYVGEKTAEELNKEKSDLLVQFPQSYGQDVVFIDSRSVLN